MGPGGEPAYWRDGDRRGPGTDQRGPYPVWRLGTFWGGPAYVVAGKAIANRRERRDVGTVDPHTDEPYDDFSSPSTSADVRPRRRGAGDLRPGCCLHHPALRPLDCRAGAPRPDHRRLTWRTSSTWRGPAGPPSGWLPSGMPTEGSVGLAQPAGSLTEAERMSGRAEEDAEGRAGLMLVLGRAQVSRGPRPRHRRRGRRRRHRDASAAGSPGRATAAPTSPALLEGDRVAVVGADCPPVVAARHHAPTEQRGVELRQGLGGCSPGSPRRLSARAITLTWRP